MNTVLVLGKRYGIFVMIFDIIKGFLAASTAKYLLPTRACAGMLAGLGAVIGHVFPFYMHFKGGRGFAPFVGMLLAADLRFFGLLVVGAALVLLSNRAVALTMSVAVMFPIAVWMTTGETASTLLALAASLLIIKANFVTLKDTLNGNYVPARVFLKKELFTKKSN